MKRNKRGFTLVEILIVVIILGILAAIVIPQFTNASTSARLSSIQSQLQTVRSQIELYKIQHSDTPPAITQMWTNLTGPTDTTGDSGTTNNATFTFGPYLQQVPTNPFDGQSAIESVSGSSSADGWYYSVSGNVYTIYARDTAGNTITTY